MLRTSSFPHILKLTHDVHFPILDGTESLMNSVCHFLSVCLLNHPWALETILVEDCCISVSMLISTYHRLNLEPNRLMTMLALLFNDDAPNDNLNNMVAKYKVSLLEMLLRSSLESDDFGMVFFKYLHKNEVFIDEWDPVLVRDLAKKLLEKDKDKTTLMHMLLVSSIAQDVMLEEVQILAKIVDSLEKLTTKSNHHLMLLNNFCYKNQRGQQFLITDLNLHRRLVHLSVKVISQLVISGQDRKRNLLALICDFLSLLATLVANCHEAKSG